MEELSAAKTAFAAPQGRKCRHTVMPFGAVNGPTTCVIMAYDLKDNWDHEAKQMGAKLDDSNGSTIITDDDFGFTESCEIGLKHVEAILRVARRCDLSWKPSKCLFFPDSVEFVGHDLTRQGNLPADSKSGLPKRWKRPTTVRDASSFVGFGNFHQRCVPCFSDRVEHMRNLVKDNEFDHKMLPSEWTKELDDEFEDIKSAILSKPLLRRIDRNKRPHLRTDFSGKGMGCALLQPGDDKESLAAMEREDAGGKCEFDTTLSGLRLLPCAFGSRLCKGIERCLHSCMGEGAALRWAIHKNSHAVHGRPFTNIGDCFGLRWIMFYDGCNPAITRLQMELVSWWFTIVHHPNRMVVDADCFSRCGQEIDPDPLLTKCTTIVQQQLMSNPPAATGEEVQAENMPGCRRNTKASANVSTAIKPCTVKKGEIEDSIMLENMPILFGVSSDTTPKSTIQCSGATHASFQLLTRCWATHGFSSGHFFSSCKEHQFPLTVVVATDCDMPGCNLMQEIGKVPTVLSSANHLLNHVKRNVAQDLQGCCITSPHLPDASSQLAFARTQAAITAEMRNRCQLKCFAFQTTPFFKRTVPSQFKKSCAMDGWHVEEDEIRFAEMGDTIDDSATFLFGFHIGVTGQKVSVQIVRPPPTRSSISQFIHKPFNSKSCAITALPDTATDEAEDDRFMLEKVAPAQPPKQSDALIISHLIKRGPRPANPRGTATCDVDHPAPPIGHYNSNPFGQVFGMFFQDEDSKTRIRCISAYECMSCWGLERNLTHRMCADPRQLNPLTNGVPGKTSHAVLQTTHDKLTDVRLSSTELIDTSQQTAPAATAQAFLNGSTTTRLPNRETWIQEFSRDQETNLMIRMINNPALVNKEQLQNIHHCCRQPMQAGNIRVEDEMLVIRESVDSIGSFAKLRIVPSSLRNIIFVAFHTNPIGSHFSVHCTFHRIRLRFFWPTMCKHIADLISKCPGCTLANARCRQKSELAHSFPVDEPFKPMHADACMVGRHQGFQGEKCHMNIVDGMSTFAVSEEICGEVNAESFSKAIMKILLNHGLCRAIVIDKDSKFRGVFIQAINLLGLNLHQASGGKHNPVLTE